jgi:hypothetical protein
MEEKWKDIPKYEGVYQISTMGRIKVTRNGDERILVGVLDKSTGYRRFSLYKDGKVERAYVHRLVAESFIPNAENKPEIDHINTIRHDNRVKNLRWVTRKENRNNPISLEHLRVAFTGENSPHYGRKRSKETKRKISEALKSSSLNHGRTGVQCKNSQPVSQYDLKGIFIAEYAGQAEAARITGIHQSDISNACNGKLSVAGGYLWRKTRMDKIEVNIDYKKSVRNRAVLQYDKSDNLIKEWSSIAEISKDLGFRAATIRACCSGQIAVSNGFIWRYK